MPATKTRTSVGRDGTATTVTEPPPAQTSWTVRGRDVLVRYAMVFVLIAIAIYARALYPGFLDLLNINNMVAAVVPVGIVALGMTYVIIGGGFDLSVTAVFAGASVVYANLANTMPLLPAFLLTVLVGVLCGVINGLVVTVVKVNPFIATLSTSSIFAGATYIYSKNLPILVDDPAFGTLGTGKWAGVWISIYLLAALVLVTGVVLAKTSYGRSVYAVGGNQEAARLAGMRVKWVSASTYMITGACAAVAGMITASQIGVGQPTIGAEITLNAIAIVIIGGTSLMGGEGAIWRTVLGLAIWAMITNIFSTQALSTGARLLTIGLIVLIAVAIDSLSRRLKS
jgi:ribose transport system permease protein